MVYGPRPAPFSYVWAIAASYNIPGGVQSAGLPYFLQASDPDKERVCWRGARSTSAGTDHDAWQRHRSPRCGPRGGKPARRCRETAPPHLGAMLSLLGMNFQRLSATSPFSRISSNHSWRRFCGKGSRVEGWVCATGHGPSRAPCRQREAVGERLQGWGGRASGERQALLAHALLCVA